MFSDIGAWFYRGLAGIVPDPAYPGFRKFSVTPRPVGDLTAVKARHRSPFGWIEVDWKLAGRTTSLDLTVPVSCSAEVRMPGAASAVVAGPGLHHFSSAQLT